MFDFFPARNAAYCADHEISIETISITAIMMAHALRMRLVIGATILRGTKGKRPMKERSVTGPGTTVSPPHLDILRHNEYLTLERALLLAMLQDAVHCFRHYSAARDRVGKRKFYDARSWIMSEGRDWVFAFDNVCECLGFDPQYVRQGIRDGKGPAAINSRRINGIRGGRYADFKKT